jgi:hypothetical protein
MSRSAWLEQACQVFDGTLSRSRGLLCGNGIRHMTLERDVLQFCFLGQREVSIP